MSIIYILTIISIITLNMLIYKKEEKLNLISWLIISIGILINYNICICVILSFLKIKSTLITLSIMNIIISILLGIKIKKDGKIQKYNIFILDIIAVVIMFIIVIIVTIMQYGIPINIKNSITDGATHYRVADEFYNYSKLLYEENSDILSIFNEGALMPGAYINTGIVFKVFSPVIEETYFCKLFIIFDVAMWLLAGLLMYALLSDNKKESKNIIALIFSLIYMLGYPLNSVLSGFSYLQVGLNAIICILFVMKQNLKPIYKDILMFLLNFGLMFSYYYFAPVVFITIFIQIITEIRKRNEKLFIAKNLLSIMISLILPGLFGIMYFIVFQIMKYGISFQSNTLSALNMPGPIYQNFILNILIFIFLAIFYIRYCFKNKKESFSIKLLINAVIFLIILFIGMKLQKVSEYYYYKAYYFLWIPLIYIAFKSIELLIEKNKIITYLGIVIYCIGIMLAIICDKNLVFFDIYQKNFEEIKKEYKLVTDKELEILEYYNKNINTNGFDNKTYINMTSVIGRARWLYVITKNPHIYVDLTVGELTTNIQQFLDSDKQYYLILKKDDNEQLITKIKEMDNLKILFQNDEGAIVEKIN